MNKIHKIHSKNHILSGSYFLETSGISLEIMFQKNKITTGSKI